MATESWSIQKHVNEYSGVMKAKCGYEAVTDCSTNTASSIYIKLLIKYFYPNLI